MTLNCYNFEFAGNFVRFVSRIWEATTAKRIKIDPCDRQRQNCIPLNVLFSDV